MASFPTTMSVPALQKGRRRRFSEDEKRTLLTEAFLNNETLSELGRRYNIAVGLLFRWRRHLGVTRASVAVQPSASEAASQAADQRLAALEHRLNVLMKDNSVLHQRLAHMESVAQAGQSLSASSEASH
ncbi:MAG: transposase [Deltaproteobacteria bacterium]|nr:transposase [Deltaproteobacteria bacterium]